MLRITSLRAIGAMLLAVVAASGSAQSLVPTKGACDRPITISAKDDAALRDAFNLAKGSVRLVFLIDPICPTCLRGLEDLDAKMLSPHASDAALQTFVINTPVLGATERDTANTCSIVHNAHVTQYWDPNQELGTLFANALGMKFGDKEVYAWDVWLVYGPSAEWTGTVPPKADFLMHQLPDLLGREGFPFLRAPAFAAEVEKQLKASDTRPTESSPRHERWPGMTASVFESTLTCPRCGHQSTESMPTDACIFFHQCAGGGVVLRPKPGDCCVFCSYGSVACPPIQLAKSCCSTVAQREA